MGSNAWLILLVGAGFGVLGFLAGQGTERRRYLRRVRRLNRTMDALMRGETTADLSPFREGELSILAGQLELIVRRTEGMVHRLEEDKQAIKAFIADVSHQLKTPLTGLLTYLDVLEAGEAAPARREQLHSCIHLAERMDELIRTLLELAKLDTDAVSLRLESFPAEELLDGVVQAAQQARPLSAVPIERHPAPGLSIRCDRKWLSQALLNVLLNALDYTDGARPVTLSAQQADRTVIVKVSNSCPALSDEELASLFRRFYRAKQAKGQGFGIGLSMTQSILKRHKGQIRAVREPDGLAIVMTLPAMQQVDHC